MNLEAILKNTSKPTPFEQVGQSIWTDPYVSRQLLAAHLSPDTDAASRQPQVIDRSVAWIVSLLRLKAPCSVLDLGCGPGLYAQRLAKLGMHVTGVDFSFESIRYARTQAIAEGLSIDYRLQNYLEMHEIGPFDLALLIYGDYCALCSFDRVRLLAIIQKALGNGGLFILDVTTRACRMKHGLKNSWYVARSGFWSDAPHLVLEQGFDYPEELIYLAQYTIIDKEGNARVFRNWFQDYTKESIQNELESAGFNVVGVYADLLGTKYTTDSDWIGLVVEKN